MKTLLLAGLLVTVAAPASAPASADDYCSNHFCLHNDVPNWWTPHGKGTYWVQNAPPWLKYPRKQQTWHTVGQ